MFYKKQVVIFLVIYFLVPVSVEGQGFPGGVYQPVKTIEESSGYRRLNAIVEDSLRFIWLGTTEGLFRFDGYNMTNFTFCEKDPLNHISGNVSILALALDQQQNLWIGTRNHGLFLKKSWAACVEPVVFKQNNSLPENFNILDMCVDHDGRVWFCTGSQGVFVYNPASNELQKIENKFCDDADRLLYAPYNATVWVLSNRQKVISIHKNLSVERIFDLPYGKQTPLEDINHNNIFLDRNGNFWINEPYEGLFYFDKVSDTWKKYPFNLDFHANPIVSVTVTPENDFYICMEDKSLYLLQVKQSRWQFFPYNTIKKSIVDIFFSKNKDMWVNCYPIGNIGVYYRNEMHTEYIPRDGNSEGRFLNNLSIPCLFPDSDQRILLGSNGKGCYQYIPATKAFVPFPLGPKNPEVIKTIYKEKNTNKIWFGHWMHGMTCYDPDKKTFTYYTENTSEQYQLNGPHVWAFEEDQNGNFWVSCLESGVAKFSKEGRERQMFFTRPLRGVSLRTLDILCDSKNNIWFAFEEHGLAVLRSETSEIEYLDHQNSGLSIDNTYCVFEDSKGNIWVGTSNGLNLWKNGRFQTFTTRDGLIGNDVLSIIEDKNNDIWVGSFKGVTKIKMGENGQLVTARIAFIKDDILEHKSACLGAGNILYFGGHWGINAIHYGDKLENNAPPHTMIVNVSTDLNTTANQDFQMLSDASDDGDINLGYRKRSVIIELASAYFNNIPLVKYQYFLENYSKEWITIENGEHKAYFTNLKEGTYTFKARSKSNLSDWGPVRQLVIHVDQPFWETDWFQWLLLLLTPILVGLLGVFQLQTQASKMKKKILEAEKMQLEADKVVLKAEVKERDIEIENKSAEIAQKQEKLLEIADLFEKLHKGTEIQKAKVLRNLHKKLESELMEEEEWEALKIYYDQSNHDFSKELLKKYPDLTDNNIRLCILMRLNMNTKEIANMLNVSVLSVQKSRYRLKKRLNIDKDEDLAAFVNSL